ncbi:creatininase family protein [Kribbella sp. CA-293567]|uniref:creatininase family protein n=1 Tax=Kribbella sp. CA-293567 TaxID=3002436 RepID=UPI0022DE1AF8|nr:creatininase family protein [Kribbella sp. CA-293567]WBQ03685.1 creatininase family protein [Kribbella sp. CA-293567]
MTTDQARDAVRLAPLVIIPVGAQEQHGGGMAMSTDTVRAEGLADLVAGRLGGRAVIAPPLNYGVSPHHMAFAGTVTLSPATFQSVLRDLVASLRQHGWSRFLVITGHGGNNAALSVLAQEYLLQPDLTFSWTPITPLVSDVIAGMEVSQVHGHAGEAETAQMLYLAPELVHADLLEPGALLLDELSPKARLSRQAQGPRLSVGFDAYHKRGVLGDPRRATAEDGRLLVETAADRIAAFADELLSA